jgi:hypothetical protein
MGASICIHCPACICMASNLTTLKYRSTSRSLRALCFWSGPASARAGEAGTGAAVSENNGRVPLPSKPPPDIRSKRLKLASRVQFLHIRQNTSAAHRWHMCTRWHKGAQGTLLMQRWMNGWKISTQHSLFKDRHSHVIPGTRDGCMQPSGVFSKRRGLSPELFLICLPTVPLDPPSPSPSLSSVSFSQVLLLLYIPCLTPIHGLPPHTWIGT